MLARTVRTAGDLREGAGFVELAQLLLHRAPEDDAHRVPYRAHAATRSSGRTRAARWRPRRTPERTSRPAPPRRGRCACGRAPRRGAPCSDRRPRPRASSRSRAAPGSPRGRRRRAARSCGGAGDRRAGRADANRRARRAPLRSPSAAGRWPTARCTCCSTPSHSARSTSPRSMLVKRSRMASMRRPRSCSWAMSLSRFDVRGPVVRDPAANLRGHERAARLIKPDRPARYLGRRGKLVDRVLGPRRIGGRAHVRRG